MGRFYYDDSQGQGVLSLANIETYGLLRQRCHEDFRDEKQTDCVRLVSPQRYPLAEKHAFFVYRGKPIIDYTDGYVSTMDLLSIVLNKQEYWSALRRLSCIQALKKSLPPDACTTMHMRLYKEGNGEWITFWAHPYEMIMYYYNISKDTSRFAALDKKIIESIYINIFSYAGRDYFREFNHALIDYGIDMSTIEAFWLHAKFDERPQPEPLLRHVYLIRQESSRLFKIGIANDPYKRLEGLQGANPNPLALVHAWRVPEAEKVEKTLHRLFGKVRRRGEWFALSTDQEAELIIYMKQYQESSQGVS